MCPDCLSHVPSVQQEKRLFTKFHRQVFCWLDKWIDLTMDDIRRMEEETQKELDEVTEDCILDLLEGGAVFLCCPSHLLRSLM